MINVSVYIQTSQAAFSYQTERAQNGQAFDLFEAQLDQTQQNYHDIKAIPFVLQIVYRVHGDDFEQCFQCEYGGEYLQKWHYWLINP